MFVNSPYKHAVTMRVGLSAGLGLMLLLILPFSAFAGIYDADTPTTYKEYWVDHSEYTGGNEEASLPDCIDTNPNGNAWYLEPWGKCKKNLNFTIPDDFSEALKAEVYLDLWRNRANQSARFQINNGQTYAPPAGANWSRTPYVMEIDMSELNTGQNTITFFNDAGPFHVHDIAFRIYYDESHPLRDSGGNIISAPDGKFVSAWAESDLLAADTGGTLLVDNDQIVLTADVTTPAKFVEFHAYYDGYDEDNDGTTLDWHNIGRNNYHPGGTDEQPTGGTINHIGTLLTPAPGRYTIVWQIPHIVEQSGVRFKIRLVDATGNVQDAAGGISAPFTLSRSGDMVYFIDSPFNDAVLHHDGLFPDTINRRVSISVSPDDYDEAYFIGAYWKNPEIQLNGNKAFKAFNSDEDDWSLSIRPVSINFLKSNNNNIDYNYTRGFGQFIEKPGPMIVLKQSTAQNDTTAPELTAVNPIADATDAEPAAAIVLQVTDSGLGVDIDSLVMSVDGTPVQPVISGSPSAFTLTYTPTIPFSNNQTVTVAVDACDYAALCINGASYLFTTRLPILVTNVVGMGTIERTPALDQYPIGTAVTVTATADLGWNFSAWSGALTGTATSESLAIDQDQIITATFVQEQYQVITATAGTGHGTVAVQPVQPTYLYGDVITLTATADSESAFTGWSGALVETTSPVTFTVTGNHVITATFAQIAYAIATNTAGPGSGQVDIAPTQATYFENDLITLTASPDPGSAFAGWSGDVVGVANPITHTVSGNHAITATFTQIPYAVTVNTTGNGFGLVAVTPQQGSYFYGDVVTFTANANPGSSFAGWRGDQVTTEPQLTLTMTDHVDLTAEFTRDYYSLTINTVDDAGNPTPKGTVVATAPGNQEGYIYGEVATLTANAAPGWIFQGWSGDVAGTTASRALTFDSDKEVTAIFAPLYYTIFVAAVDDNGNPTTNGSVSISPPQNAAGYLYGEMVIVSATPMASDWRFVNWQGVTNSNSAVTTFSVTQSGVATATFTDKIYSLTAILSDDAGGTITYSPAPPYQLGQEVMLTVVPTTGWAFTGWLGDLSGTTNPASIVLDTHRVVTATVERIEYTVQVGILGGQNQVAGTVSMNPATGPFYYGDVVTLTATPNSGYRFVQWIVEETSTDLSATAVTGFDPTDPQIAVSVTGTVTYLAEFSPNSASGQRVFLPIVVAE